MSSEYQSRYAAFKRALESLDELVQPATAPSVLKRSLTELQHFFQTELGVNTDTEPSLPFPENAAKLNALNVEISKQLRLLGTDITFLQAARKTATLEQRIGQIHDRLNTLMRYCDQGDRLSSL